MKESPLRAGAARADITPEPGIQLAGDIGRYRPTEEIRDRLYCNALVLETGEQRVCLLSCDLLGVSNYWADKLRGATGELLGIPQAAVALHAVQNHASPTLGHFFVKDECSLIPPEYPWLRGGDERYNGPTVECCLAAVTEARDNLQSVTMAMGRGTDGRVAFNRRFIMRDGSARCHPPNCDPDIAHVEGPMDPEVGVVTFTGEQNQVVAALLHHTCHPCHGYPHRYVIGDWPGAWSELMRRECGESCVPLVVNGCCGNIHHTNHIDPDRVSEYRAMAGKLMETTSRVMQTGMRVAKATPLAYGQTALSLPLRLLTDEVVAAARDIVDAHPEPMWLDEVKTRVDWDWVYAVATLDLEDTQAKNPRCDYEIQGFRIGDLAVATLMGEPFVEGQLRIKLASPAPQTMVAHFCNGFAGYVPTREALERGGYETRTANWSKFQPDALEQIITAASGLIGGLFGE